MLGTERTPVLGPVPVEGCPGTGLCKSADINTVVMRKMLRCRGDSVSALISSCSAQRSEVSRAGAAGETHTPPHTHTTTHTRHHTHTLPHTHTTTHTRHHTHTPPHTHTTTHTSTHTHTTAHTQSPKSNHQINIYLYSPFYTQACHRGLHICP